MTALAESVAGAGGVAPETPVRPGGRRGGAWRFGVLGLLGLYFLVPIAASVWFTVRNRGTGEFTAEHYTGIPGAEGFAESFTRSLVLAALTVLIALALMLPTVVLVNLRLPRLRTTVELLTLMPLVVPPIALVVGVRSVLAWAPDYFLDTPLAEVFFAIQEPELPWILVFVYVVLALPFVYRALDSGVRGADLRTLTEAARNLGASWPRVLLWVVLPVLRTSVLNAAFLTFALVLGEFTFANILGFETFPTWILRVSGSEPQLSVAVSVLSLVVTWMLLLLISALDRRRGTKENS
ncbi:putative spermidine/putrescine transport system permease protein [Blastococcus aurantiacus]|uniref:Putative spermidine/putrescine transport system permease protein n=1 Tax=Blastococcus aurantiacus TaxID=1550231 RepID=A0A1G7KLI2_9ACTN|nr:ABC transporter permease [Blastococcus aurantiacus]SDF38118.1 putative spermidine/putrescine transport system permease protein [Blastococcus aurantiacus]